MPGHPLRIAAVTDIHHGRPFQMKKSDRALALLEDFTDAVAGRSPDLVVDLGDRINDVDHDTDHALMTDVADRFKRITARREHLPGNHDVHHLDLDENEALFESSMRSRSLDLAGWHLVFWCPDMHYATKTGFLEDLVALEWLERDLADHEGPTVVFCHVPPLGGDLRGNYWFQNNPWAGELPYAERALEILAAHPGVTLTVGGHLHWARLQTLHGIHHVTLPSLIEGFHSGGEASGAWSEIALGETISITIHGREPSRLELPVRAAGRIWPEPRPSARAR